MINMPQWSFRLRPERNELIKVYVLNQWNVIVLLPRCLRDKLASFLRLKGSFFAKNPCHPVKTATALCHSQQFNVSLESAYIWNVLLIGTLITAEVTWLKRTLTRKATDEQTSTLHLMTNERKTVGGNLREIKNWIELWRL